MLINNKVMPDFLIVGAARSATTSLYHYLNDNPKVFMSKTKEPYFFSFYDKNRNFIDFKDNKKIDFIVDDLKDYENLFKEAESSHIIGEASTYYLYFFKDTIENIKKIYGSEYRKLKIIIVLRNPIERAWSHYIYKKRNFEENLNFPDAIKYDVIENRKESNFLPCYDYTGFGKYCEQVKAYLESFENVHIVFNEDMNHDMGNVMNDLETFLNLPQLSDTTYQKHNASGKPKNKVGSLTNYFLNRPSHFKNIVKKILPLNTHKFLRLYLENKTMVKDSLLEVDRNSLREYFQQDIQCLERLLSKDLSHWLHS